MRVKYSRMIKQEADRLGFGMCGISKAGFLEEEAPRLQQWLNQGMQGEMHYMEKYTDERLDPVLLVDGAKSVISLILNYYPRNHQRDPEAPKISKYAYGKDYHFVIRQKLHQLIFFIREHIGDVKGRAFVDSAPIMDKVWAAKSGLGWIGKNTNLINAKHGSFFFIAEIVVDLELEYDKAVPDHCGSCTACMDACPTEAIVAPYIVDGSKCISYFTIELKGAIPDEYKGKFENWAFGCDICQDVCPWNRFSKVHNEALFEQEGNMLEMNKADWEVITQEVFNRLFRKSAVKRTKYHGLRRNIDFLK